MIINAKFRTLNILLLMENNEIFIVIYVIMTYWIHFFKFYGDGIYYKLMGVLIVLSYPSMNYQWQRSHYLILHISSASSLISQMLST